MLRRGRGEGPHSLRLVWGNPRLGPARRHGRHSPSPSISPIIYQYTFLSYSVTSHSVSTTPSCFQIERTTLTSCSIAREGEPWDDCGLQQGDST